MNIALERLLEGIVTTLRSDVIPHVADPYARGQAVGVIDLLNNIAPKLEWARGPLLAEIDEKRGLLRSVSKRLPAVKHAIDGPLDGTTDLRAERDRLDGLIGDALTLASQNETSEGAEVLALIREHLHDSLTREMKLTRKPLFAEIASGSGKPPP